MMKMPSFFSNRVFKISRNPYRRKNLRAFVVCLFISVIAWGFIKISDVYETDFEVPLVLVNEKSSEIVAAHSHQQVTYRLQANGFNTFASKLFPKVDTVFLDVSSAPRIIKDGNSWAYFTDSQIKSVLSRFFSSDQNVLQVLPDTVFALLGKASEKKVPVEVNANLSFEKGFGRVGGIVMLPDSVIVKGPKNMVDTLTAIFTRLVELQNLSAPVSQSVELVNPSRSSGFQLSAGRTIVSFSVEEFTETSFDLPVAVRFAENQDGKPFNIKLFPERVQVVCLVPLRAFSSFKPTDLVAYVLAPLKSDEVMNLQVFVESNIAHVKIQAIAPALVECIILEE